jgi:hypothetical protein
MERQPIYHISGDEAKDGPKCQHCGQVVGAHTGPENYCPMIPTFTPDAPAIETDALRRRTVELERLLKVRETVSVRLLRAAEDLIGAPVVVGITPVHEDDRTLGVVLANGKFFLRKLVRDGYEWSESQPIPGTPAALLEQMYLFGVDDEAAVRHDAAVAQVLRREGPGAAA